MNDHELAADILGHETFRAVRVDQVNRWDLAIASEPESGLLAVVEYGLRLKVDRALR